MLDGTSDKEQLGMVLFRIVILELI